ncbi:MAG: hypothetical protein ACFCU3_10180 [Verrucomicrobiales bacterium]
MSNIASDHLRVIRSLMERATIYRALSAPAAAISGILALIGAIAFPFVSSQLRRIDEALLFFLYWLVILACVALSHYHLLRMEAKKEGKAFPSPAMKLALACFMPPILIAGFVSGLILMASVGVSDHLYPMSSVWMIGYGLGLLAMRSFAPSSILTLGWVFSLAGCILLCVPFVQPSWIYEEPFLSCAAMGITFGAFHLIYAVVVRSTAGKKQAAGQVASPE